jgi:hypothetical protein
MTSITKTEQRGTRSPRAWLLGLVAAIALLPGSASALMISEVMYNPVGADDGFEWVELYNDGPDVDLADYSLGWGGADYTVGTLDLDGAGILASGTYIVIGAVTGFDFNPDLEDGFLFADGVALFNLDAAAITPTTTPLDSLIYASFFGFNAVGLIDSTGNPGAVLVTIAAEGESAERDALGNWQAQATPTPGVGNLPPAVPEPSTAQLVGLGLRGQTWHSRRRR